MPRGHEPAETDEPFPPVPDRPEREEALIYTVGHGIRPIAEFVALLRQVGIGLLVDVRTAPGSRRHPQFGRSSLALALEDAGIGYEWRKDLGGWRRPLPDSPHTALRSASFRGYADHMASDSFAAALAWLVETSSSTTAAVMCAETLWWRCHRRMIADALLLEGRTVAHIVAAKKIELHQLHPAARVTPDGLVYDQSEAPAGPTSTAPIDESRPRPR